MAITKIIHTGDIHIRNLRRLDEYQEQLSKFINECKNIVSDNGEENTRIVIAGDLLHNKLDISGEGYVLASWFLRQLDKICKTIVIAGNHDMNMANTSRLDPLSAIFSMCRFNNVHYLDKQCKYGSAFVEDGNIFWCLFSSFSSFERPQIEEARALYPDKKYIGLFHGEVKNATTDTGFISVNGLEPIHFNDLDFCLMGHIHKFQKLDWNGIPLVYCGSLIQQDHGENISGHGYVLWDVETEKYELVEIPNEDRGFYTISVNGIGDIEEGKERVLNL